MRNHNLTSFLLAAAMCLGLAFATSTVAPAQGPCASTVSFVGAPRIGAQISMVVSGSNLCHSCLWISKNAGPTVIPPVTIPIGLPLLNWLDYGAIPPSGSFTVPISIPADPNLIGLSLYFSNVSFPSNQTPSVTNLQFSPAAILTFLP